MTNAQSNNTSDFRLIYEGPRDDSSETLRKVKSALIADLNINVEQVKFILENAPVTILRANSELDLKAPLTAMKAAGAKVLIVKAGLSSDDDEDLEDDSSSEEEFSIEVDESDLEENEIEFSMTSAPQTKKSPKEIDDGLTAEEKIPDTELNEEVEGLLSQLEESSIVLDQKVTSTNIELDSEKFDDDLKLSDEDEVTPNLKEGESTLKPKNPGGGQPSHDEIASLLSLDEEEGDEDFALDLKPIDDESASSAKTSQQPSQSAKSSGLSLDSTEEDPPKVSTKSPEPQEKTEIPAPKLSEKPLKKAVPPPPTDLDLNENLDKILGGVPAEGRPQKNPDDDEGPLLDEEEFEPPKVTLIGRIKELSRSRFWRHNSDTIIEALIAITVLIVGNFVYFSAFVTQPKAPPAVNVDALLNEEQLKDSNKSTDGSDGNWIALDGEEKTANFETRGRFEIRNDKISLLNLTVEITPPKELSPEELVRNLSQQVHLNKIEIDRSPLERVDKERIEGRSIAKIFYVEGSNRGRTIADALITGFFDKDKSTLTATIHIMKGIESFPEDKKVLMEKTTNGTFKVAFLTSFTATKPLK